VACFQTRIVLAVEPGLRDENRERAKDERDDDHENCADTQNGALRERERVLVA
jgi:hypothetical protein